MAGICRDGQHGLSIRSHVERLTYARCTTVLGSLSWLGLLYANARLSDPAHPHMYLSLRSCGGTLCPVQENPRTLVEVPAFS